RLEAPMMVALRRITTSGEEFQTRAEALKTDLAPVSASYAAARRAIEASYLAAFRERSKAMLLFRQALTPLSSTTMVERVKVFDRIDQQFASAPSTKPLVLLGDEGVGKTWVIASYWLRRGRNYLFILIPSKAAALNSSNALRLLETSICDAISVTSREESLSG